MKLLQKYSTLISLVFILKTGFVHGQVCTNLGQTPSTAFPVCGTTVFHQSNVPICATVNIFVPGCSNQPGSANYQNKNPYFYKFTCYTSGTLGFLISPLAANEDYDWQLWDITGHNPDEIFTNNSLVVTGNWAGTYGNTGASASGVSFIQCASFPPDNAPTFSKMPNLVAGHEYILMVSHYSDGQSGYDLSFSGGTAVITDPSLPQLLSAKPDCDGKNIIVKLKKKVKCASLTLTGTEFSLSPAVTTIISATPDSCSFGFDFDELTLTLALPVPDGNYDLIINNGSDGNTLRDNCDNLIQQGEKISFSYTAPQPIFADSLGRVGCAPDSVRIYFPKKIICSSIAADGSDFFVTGPGPVTVSGASGNCVNGKTDFITVKFSTPVFKGGTYNINFKTGNDGTVVIDECGKETPRQTLSFTTADTVSADFQYQAYYGCRNDTLFFSHNGANGSNIWKWSINNAPTLAAQTTSMIFPATSSNTVKLFVSNGVCNDSSSVAIVLNNEVKASFEMETEICPEDKLAVKNSSVGNVDVWLWRYGSAGSSLLKDPLPFQFPVTGREVSYSVKLVATNLSQGCSDSAMKTVKVFSSCTIYVPTGFTPNDDGLNDYFSPLNALKADNYEFLIFNRWGQLIFHSKNWRERWDGKIHGLPQQPGVYAWLLKYTNRDTKQSVIKKGTVTLIR